MICEAFFVSVDEFVDGFENRQIVNNQVAWKIRRQRTTISGSD